MPDTIFANCHLHRPMAEDGVLDKAWILVAKGRVKKIGGGPEPKAGERVDLGGARVLPGLINAHSRLHGSLAGRLHWQEEKPATLRETLRRSWWRLDRALDEKSLRASARFGLHEAVRRGTTTLIDLHSSPGIEEGALGIIAEEAERFGIKVALSCEVSDRNGEEPLEDAMDENLRAMNNFGGHETIRGVYGLHAPFTLSEESIEQALEILPFETPFHLCCAEGPEDNESAVKLGYESAVDRLAALGVLRQGTILAHGVHLKPGDLELIREMGAFVVHCPQSNARHRVGAADVGAMLGAGVKVGLGSDGFLTGMLTELQFARDLGADTGTLLPVRAGELLFDGNPAIASSVFGRPIGWLEVGEDADFIVQGDAESPLDASAKLLRVVSRGATICENGVVVGMDAKAIHAEAEREAKRVARLLG